MLSVGHCLLSRLWFMYLEDSEGNRAASEILVTSIYWTFIPFTQCVREWYLIPSILYKAGAVMIPFLGWGNQDPKKRSQEPMAVAFFSEGVRTCSQDSTLSLWASAALTNYGMSLGDGSLGRTVLWKKMDRFITQTCKWVSRKNVSDSSLLSETNAGKPILTVSLFCCLKASDM